ncbi:MAG TPA: COX15/CtaA family protein, partial [Longimicrobiales bacterium]|nr:COX15/CtaA family protein [Longimicrobiales bacterium]
VTALSLLATFAVIAVRAGMFDGALATVRTASAPLAPVALITAAIGLLVVGFGALTANVGMTNLSGPGGAALACQGFPLCNGKLLPGATAWVDIQWTHRMLAYLLFFYTFVAGIASIRRAAPPAVATFAKAAMALVVLQVIVAAGLVLMHLPQGFRGLHLAVGAALWGCLAFWAALARRADGTIIAEQRSPAH